MLNELIKYAEKNGISDTPGFKAKRGKWLILLTNDGEFIDVVKDDRRYDMCPHLEQFELVGGETKSHYLLDSLGVVVNYEPKDKDMQKHEYFLKMLEEASKYEPCLKACRVFLSDKQAVRITHEKLKALKAKGTENVTFNVNGINVVETTGWHDWWIQYRKTINGEKPTQKPMVCIVDGELTEPVTNHFKISGLNIVDGQASGTALISFDKDSFTSYNLSQSLNASCSERVAAAYRNSLDDLIEKAPQPICNSMFLHWYKESIPFEDDPFGFINFIDNSDTESAGAMNKARKLFEAVRKGERPELTDNIYYILQVSGSGGRIMVRDWQTGDFRSLVGNINTWFDDLSIVSPHGKSIASDFKLSAGMLRLVSYRKNEKIGDTFSRIKKELTPLEPLIWRSIIQNSPLPDTVAARALQYISSRLLGSEQSLDDNLDRVACALLKAYIIRIKKMKGENVIMKPELDPSIPEPSYQAGRMLAVLGSIQQCAMGDVNAGLIQRYYTSASTSPKLVIGKLVQVSQHHLDKIGKENKRLAVWYENQLTDIMARIKTDQIPLVLNLEGQTLFALGYYQQKAYMQAGKADEASNN